MVRINYNQKETKRRPWCFNYFSHIIWFCGGKPGTAKKRKMKSNLNYMERKCRGFLHMVHLFPTTVDKADDYPQNLAVNCPWKQNLDAATLYLSCSAWPWLKERCWNILTADWQEKKPEPFPFKKKRCLLWHTWSVGIQIIMTVFCCFA